VETHMNVGLALLSSYELQARYQTTIHLFTESDNKSISNINLSDLSDLHN